MASIQGVAAGINGESGGVGRALYSWGGGSGDAVDAPYAWHFHDGGSGSGNGYRQDALCLVASFG